MPIPVGTYPVTGPLLDVTGAFLTPTTDLRDAGVVSLREGRLRRVNQTATGWEDIPGHHIGAAEPAQTFEGQIWYNTGTNTLATYNGTEFVTAAIHALNNDEIDDEESDTQGTVSGRGLARAVDEHSPFTDIEQDILEDLSRQTFPHPTDDWRLRQTYSTRDFFTDQYSTFLSLGWDADNRLRALSGDGHVARLGGHDRGRIYDGSDRLRAGLISGEHWLFLRDNGNTGSAIIRAPVDGGDATTEFESSDRYFSLFADPDSGTLLGVLRRVSDTDIEIGLLAYNAVTETITAEDTITLTRAAIDAALGADFQPLPDIHRESGTGVYQEVAGAILEGDTLYILLTDIAKADGHTVSVLVGFTLAGTPNNRTLTVLAENAVDETAGVRRTYIWHIATRSR